MNFANTPAFPGAPMGETLFWEELISFLEAAKIISPERAERLLQLTETEPQTAAALLSSATKLRTALRGIFEAVIRKEAPEPQWIRTINATLQITEGHDELVTDGAGGWKIEFIARNDGLEWLLAVVARSAAELLAEGPGTRLRKCANPICGLLFYDNSRTRKRRWCSMALCGNRSKVAAFARRRQSRRCDP